MLDEYRTAELSLDDLANAARRLLEGAPPPGDTRVAPFPDGRTLRYYQSMGVLDRPLRYDGRQAVYGYRHLLQATCVKLLQGQGYTLAQVQRSLSGATSAQLESAVAEALELGPPSATPPAVSPLVAAVVAPGVHVTLDPALVSDPAAVLLEISRALARMEVK